MTRTLATLLALVVLGTTPSARADDDAAVRFDRGVELARLGDAAGALAEFEASWRQSGRWEVLFNIGVAEKRLGRPGRAIRALARYLAEGAAAIAADRRAAVEAELGVLRALVAEVTIEVAGAPARLRVDDLDEGTTPLTGPLLLGPGRHRVRVARDGEVDAEVAIDVVSGEHRTVRLAPTPPAPTTAEVTIDSTPRGARLLIDEAPVGVTPWRGTVGDGGHALRAELAGHRGLREEFSVEAGQVRALRLELVPLPREAPAFYRRTWFWGVVGGVVAAGAAISIGLALQPEEPDVVIRWP